MPKIFEYFGLIFYFFSNEHTPIHVHVTKGNCETIFELIIQEGILIDVRKRYKNNKEPLPPNEEKTAILFINKYANNIIDKWIKFFVLNKQVRSTSIKKKL